MVDKPPKANLNFFQRCCRNLTSCTLYSLLVFGVFRSLCVFRFPRVSHTQILRTVLIFYFPISLSVVPFVVIGISLAGSLTFSTSAIGAGFSVTKQFRKAADLIKKGKIRAAQKILKKIINKYPEHEPSLLLMARVQYRLGRPKKSYRFFKKVAVGLLDSTSAFEYGIVAYGQKDWKRALKGFKRVDAKDELKTFARYYAAVCFLKQRLYRKALSRLRKAKGLPASLSASRRKMIRIAKDRIRLESAGGTFRQGPQLVVPAPAVLGWAPLPPEPEDRKRKKKKKKAIVGPVTGVSLAVTPAITWLNKSSSTEYSGTRAAEGSSKSFTGGLGLLGRYDLSPMSFGGQPNIGLGVNLSEITATSSGKDTKFFIGENTGAAESEATVTPDTDADSFVFAIKPTAAVPLTKDFDLFMYFKYTETWPDNDSAKMIKGSMTTSATLNASLGEFSAGTTGTYAQALGLTGPTSSKFTSKTTVSGSASIINYGADFTIVMSESLTETPLAKSIFDVIISGNASSTLGVFALAAVVKNTESTPNDHLDFVPGAALSRFEMSGTVSTSLEFGISLSAQGVYGIFSGYGRNDLVLEAATEEGGEDVTAEAVTEGSDVGFTLTGKVSPLDWLFFSMAYTRKTTSYEITDPDVAPIFFQTVPDYSTSLTLSAGVTKTF